MVIEWHACYSVLPEITLDMVHAWGRCLRDGKVRICLLHGLLLMVHVHQDANSNMLLATNISHSYIGCTRGRTTITDARAILCPWGSEQEPQLPNTGFVGYSMIPKALWGLMKQQSPCDIKSWWEAEVNGGSVCEVCAPLHGAQTSSSHCSVSCFTTRRLTKVFFYTPGIKKCTDSCILIQKGPKVGETTNMWHVVAAHIFWLCRCPG